ncbi:MAG: hypothetical protein O4861_15100 [Trichodesmium sp. St16_bin4-tuft]|nr:hypothetical protein [Trichodesmium sp. St4_bin8_1]MDE5072478.1 hypothetical protein [Trichodesmium sp. St5_bin8]MDE5092027.1 hypothetical protein [Trichodesmium sp. St18_bin3_1_1]MDE5099581.1 hypothetical protein [Trichodesmium sp. St16_bin4-tuft]
MAQLYSIVTPNLTGTKLSLDSLYELALIPQNNIMQDLRAKLQLLSNKSVIAMFLTHTVPKI